MEKPAFSEVYQEAVAAGETAFASGDYKTALEYFRQAMQAAPNDVYALSRAGASAVAVNEYDEAKACFQKALDLEPENGDNAFNMGNVYFFRADLNHAVEQYARAEILGCSKPVKARLYYQLSLINMIQGNFESAIKNFEKFENSDDSKRALSEPKVIMEKLKLYMMAKDFARSAECAVQLIQMAPQELRGYIVYFNLLVGAKKLDEAEKILDEAEQYATMNDNGRLTLKVERISLYLLRAGFEPENAAELREQALEMIRNNLSEAQEGSRAYNQMLLSLAEVQVIRHEYQEAAAAAAAVLPENDAESARALIEQIQVHKDLDPATNVEEPSEEQLDEMLNAALADLSEKINVGLISPYLIEQATVYYDSDNRQIREYPEGAFDAMDQGRRTQVDAAETVAVREGVTAMRPDFYERARFLLINALISLDQFELVKKHAALLRNSKNTMYAFFAMYAEALAVRKTGGDANDEIYNALLSFYRGRMLKKDYAPYAAMYRARMYAETGKFAKAEEMAKLVPASEKQEVADYIMSLRQTDAS